MQRTLDAATRGAGLAVTGVFDAKTDAALRAWQKAAGRHAEGVVNRGTWSAFASGTLG